MRRREVTVLEKGSDGMRVIVGRIRREEGHGIERGEIVMHDLGFGVIWKKEKRNLTEGYTRRLHGRGV